MPSAALLSADGNPPEAHFATCFLDAARQECRYDEGAILDDIEQDDLAYQFCYLGKLKRLYGDEITFANEELDSLLDRVVAGASVGTIGRDLLRAFIEKRPALQGVGPNDREHARAQCAARFPNARKAFPTLQDVQPSLGPIGNCYQGQLGEYALGVLLAGEQVETARARVSGLSESYEIAMRHCMEERATETERSRLEAAQNGWMTGMSALKTAVDVAAIAVGQVNVLKQVTSGGASNIEAGLKATSQVIGTVMERAERNHREAIANLQGESRIRLCFNDAQMHLTGMRAATNVIAEQMIALERARTMLRNLKASGGRAVHQGRAALARLAARSTTHIAQTPWLGRALADYERKMNNGRRLAFLAVRAAESALQLSIEEDLRGAAIGARLASDLETIASRLGRRLADRRVGGRSVGDQMKVSVISLRDQLLQVDDRSDISDGRQNLAAADLFRSMLRDEKYGVYGPDGTFLGQRVPFSLVPFHAFGLATAESAATEPLFSTSSCAERLWSVAISFQGPQATMVTGSNSLPQVQLRKANTFFSQRCSGDGSMQVESIRPWRNLESGEAGPSDAVLPFQAANIQVSVNTATDDLRGAGGGSADRTLAGMGLFGDYELFFAAGDLAANPDSAGVHLEYIEDILLRIEFIGTAR
jgi:hypothetical protein